MNSRERWIATLQRKPVDRVPCDIWATEEVFKKLCNKFNCQTIWELFDKLEIDAPYMIDPPYIGSNIKEDFDMWGVGYKTINYGSGFYKETMFSPLKDICTLNELKSFTWPNADNFDYIKLKTEVEKFSHRPIRAGYVEPFLIYSRMRGLEQAMIDLVTRAF